MLRDERGLTLVELLVVLVLSLIVTGLMYSLYRVQTVSTEVQTTIAEMQQELRASVDSLSRELQMIGYDPEGKGGFGVKAVAQVNGVSLGAGQYIDKAEMDKVEKSTDTLSFLTYSYDETTSGDRVELYDKHDGLFKLRLVAGAAVVEDVEYLELYYHMVDGSKTLTPANLADIRGAEISLLVRSPRESSDYVHDTKTTYTTASGVEWKGFDDHYRRRFVRKIIKFRNVGL